MDVFQKARNIAQHAFQFVLDKIKSVKGKVFSGSRSGTSSKDLQEMLGKLSDRMQAVLGGQGSLGRKLATDFAVGSTRLMVEDYLYENYGIDLPFFPLNRKAFSTKLGATSRGGTGGGSGQTPKKQGESNKGTGNTYTPVEYKGTTKVGGQTKDISRRVYQRSDINWNQIDPETGLTNLELMKKGRPPYWKDGTKVELHHTIQLEPGPMVELPASLHDKYSKILHGLVENGGSFRNNPELEKQYNNFRSKYWRWRVKQLEGKE